MRKSSIFFILFLFKCCTVSAMDLATLRTVFYNASISMDSAEKMVKLLRSVGENDNPLLIGYKGMGFLLIAKHSYNPFEKIKYFRKGKELLEKAIEKDHNNIELKFLRFGAQTNVPGFLNYNDDIENDKLAIIKDLDSVKDISVKRNIINYLVQSKKCYPEEKKFLLAALAEH